MSETEIQELSFSDDEQTELIRYRAVSRLALIALLVGLFSPVAIAHSLLIVIPLTAVVIAVMALRKMSSVSNQLVGRKAAVIGLVLGCFFGGWALSRDVSKRSVVHRQAQEYAAYWLDLVRGARIDESDTAEVKRDKNWRLYEAFELTLDFNRRQPRGIDLAEVYGDPYAKPRPPQRNQESLEVDIKETFRNTIQAEPFNTIVKVGREGDLQFVGVHDHYFRADTETIVLLYSLGYQEGGRPTILRFLVYLKRTDHEDHKQWHIDTVTQHGSRG